MGNESVTQRKKGATLSKLELKVLERIAGEGFQTFQELRGTVLRQYNRTYAWDLLRGLTSKKFVIRCGNGIGGILGWSASREGLNLVPKKDSNGHMLCLQATTYKTSFEHDLILRELKRLFIQSECISNWTPEFVLRSRFSLKNGLRTNNPNDQRFHLIPDATFVLTSFGQRYLSVLELELTHKSRKRIFRKFESHLTSSEFQVAFFVSRDEPMQNRLMDIYQSVLAKSVSLKVNKRRNGIYFGLLDSLRNQGLQTNWKGPGNGIVIGNLAPHAANPSTDAVG